MPYKRITRKEAREYKRRAEAAELRLRNVLTYETPGIQVDYTTCTSLESAKYKLARKLGHGLIAVPAGNSDHVFIYAVKP